MNHRQNLCFSDYRSTLNHRQNLCFSDFFFHNHRWRQRGRKLTLFPNHRPIAMSMRLAKTRQKKNITITRCLKKAAMVTRTVMVMVRLPALASPGRLTNPLETPCFPPPSPPPFTYFLRRLTCFSSYLLINHSIVDCLFAQPGASIARMQSSSFLSIICLTLFLLCSGVSAALD